MTGVQTCALPISEIRRRSSGSKLPRVAILAFGSMLKPALEAAEEIDATVINMRFVKPMDEDLIREMANTHDLIVTIEENVIAGGAGSGVAEILQQSGLTLPMIQMGLPDRFIDHGDPAALLVTVGLSKEGIVAAVRAKAAA